MGATIRFKSEQCPSCLGRVTQVRGVYMETASPKFLRLYYYCECGYRANTNADFWPTIHGRLF